MAQIASIASLALAGASIQNQAKNRKVEARARGTFYEDLPGFARKEKEIKEWKKDELRRQQKKNTHNKKTKT